MLKTFVASTKSCRFENENGYCLEPKFGKIILEGFEPGDITLFLKKISGNGKIIVKTNIEEKQITILSKTGEKIILSSCNKIEITRPKDSIGQVSLFNILEPELVLNWKNIISCCGDCFGIRLIENVLHVNSGGWIDSANISNLETLPTNIFIKEDDKYKFISSGQITNIVLNSNIETKQKKQIYPHIERLEETVMRPKIQQSSITNTIVSERKIIFDSDVSKIFASTQITNSGKLVKNIRSTGKDYLSIKRFGQFVQTLSNVEFGKDYVLSITAKKLNGNGKLKISLSENICESIFLESSFSTKNIKLNCGHSKLILAMMEDSSGELLISKLTLSLFDPDYIYNEQAYQTENIKLPIAIKETKINVVSQNNNIAKFVIVIPSYNNKKWCVKNIASALNQNYSNYRIIFTDDASIDGTFDLVQNTINKLSKTTQVTFVKNEKRVGALENIYNMIYSCDDNEIILTLDGDDWLMHENVLSKLNEIYSKNDIWLTYGQYQNFPDNKVGLSKQYQDQVIESSTFRQSTWGASHLRTFYSWLFKLIRKEDLMENNKFFQMTWDFAIMFPMLEMAGKYSKFVSDILYVYNVENPINDHKVNEKLQQKLSHQIITMPQYKPLSFVHFNELGKFGRVGNQLFQVAATLVAAQKNNAVPNINWRCNYTNKDISCFFKNKIKNNSKLINASFTYNEPHFHYSEIPNHKNMNLHGYFQSERYFENHKDLIRHYFEPSDDLVARMYLKYGEMLSTNTCAIHVRRGDFVNSKVHEVCNFDYYHRAIEFINTKTKIDNFLVFSDDIEWCKKNFQSNFQFITDNLDVEDLFLQSFCQHNIISNSSFSWWGSWLNKNPSKIIISPKNWFAPGSVLNDKDIYTKEMIRI